MTTTYVYVGCAESNEIHVLRLDRRLVGRRDQELPGVRLPVELFIDIDDGRPAPEIAAGRRLDRRRRAPQIVAAEVDPRALDDPLDRVLRVIDVRPRLARAREDARDVLLGRRLQVLRNQQVIGSSPIAGSNFLTLVSNDL